jgi:hypothetical protein
MRTQLVKSLVVLLAVVGCNMPEQAEQGATLQVAAQRVVDSESESLKQEGPQEEFSLLEAQQADALEAMQGALASRTNALIPDTRCNTNFLPANDDGSTGAITLPFQANFFGTTYSWLYVNNNGNVTFREPMSIFTPFQLTSSTPPIIAAFFADVDTRGTGSGLTRYGVASYEGRTAFCVNWVSVGYYAQRTDKLNTFQLLLVDRGDTGAGNFDIVMNYDKIQWETGGASGGSNGLGGTSAGAGFSAGNGNPENFFQMPGSLVNGAFLDTNPTRGLIWTSRNSTVLGRHIFQIRNGRADVTPPVSTLTVGSTPDSSGTYAPPVTVRITATDAESGVQSITYSLSGAQTGGATVAGNSVELTLNQVGATTITWSARDVAGNVEVTRSREFRLRNPDVTPPVSTLTVNAMPGPSGFYRSPLPVLITATDDLSGVAGITYSLSGATVGSGTVAGSSLNLSLTGDGTTVLTWFARDVAGNVEAAQTRTFQLSSQPTWTDAAGQSGCHEKALHESVLLNDGRVLAVGGYNTKTDVYDPTTGLWSPTGSVSVARRYHTATLLPDGRVLVAGGVNGSASTSTELYDPSTGSWSRGAAMNVARHYHTATLLPDGRVLVAGGASGSALGTAELYDPATGTWSLVGGLNQGRGRHTATLLTGGRVLVAGGQSSSGSALTAAEVYDSASGTWTATGSLGAARVFHTATRLADGRVLVTGGGSTSALNATAEVYDPATGAWSFTGSMNGPRRYHDATLLPSGKVLVTGGYDAWTGTHTSAELYDPATGTWSLTAPMRVERYHHTATLLNQGWVLVIGGFSSVAQGSNEIYEP